MITAAPGWHPGVVGLVAARLKERFGRPAFAIAIDQSGIGTGSGRSILGVDLGGAVRGAVRAGLLVKGGGHAMAAGITMSADKLSVFRAHMEETLGPSVTAARTNDALLIDGAITATAANPELCTTVAKAGPFGGGNPEPVFVFPAHAIAYAEPFSHGHVRARLRAGDGAMLSAVAFRAVGKPLGEALLKGRGSTFHAAGTLAVDRWQGGERVQLRLIDVAPVLDPTAPL